MAEEGVTDTGTNESTFDPTMSIPALVLAAQGKPLTTAQVYEALRQLAVLSAPQYQGQALQGMQEWQRLANASPAALTQTLRPQIQQIRDQLQAAFQTLGQRLGPYGGAQTRGAQSQALGQAGTALARLFAGGQQQGVQGLSAFLQRMRPALLSQLPQLTEPQQQPFNWQGLGQLGAQAAGLAGQLYPQGQAPTIAGLNPGYTPTVSPTLSGYNSGYGGFAQYGA